MNALSFVRLECPVMIAFLLCVGSAQAQTQGEHNIDPAAEVHPSVILEGKVRTYDMGGSDSTLDVAKAVADGL